MSTKIYDAYKYKGNMTQLMDWFYKIRKEYKTNVLKQLELYYEKNKGEYKKKHDYLSEVRISMSKSYPDNEIFSPSLCAIVYFDKDDILVQFFGLYNYHAFKYNIKKIIKRKRTLVDYHFQNQCMDDVDNEYLSREKIWDRIYRNSAIPSQDGLTYQFFTDYDLMDLMWTD